LKNGCHSDPGGGGGWVVVQIDQFRVATSIIKERDHGIQTKLKQSINITLMNPRSFVFIG